MAVTGAIFNSLVFGGVNSADYGIYITGEGVFNAPKRAVNMVAVPGRNGSIAIDQGHWENIEVTYPAGTFGMDEQEFRTALSNFRNAIASQVGYQRLTDTYHPDEYRMALYSDGLEVEPTTYNKAGEFELKFNCKPQRWLTAGEVPVTIGEWGATKEASGEIVTIESEGGEAAKSLEVSLEPIQAGSGEPSPDNVRPISGRTEVVTNVAGKNLLPIIERTATTVGVTATVNADGSVTLNGTATGNGGILLTESLSGKWLAEGTYYGKLFGNNLEGLSFQVYSNGHAVMTKPSGSFVIPSDSETNYMRVRWASGTVFNNVTVYPMLTIGTTEPTTYIAPQTETHTTSLGRTVYGGTLDVVSGVLTVDKEIVDLGSLTWTRNTTDYSYPYFYTNGISGYTAGKLVCSCYKYASGGKASLTDGTISYYSATSTRIAVRNDSYTDATAFKTAMSGQTVVYPLATPQTYQLTPMQISLLLGENHVWSDGSITMQYGTNPNSLWNPTRYDAGPLLITDGYGTISFNGYDIEITHVPVGWVTLVNQGKKYLTTALPNASGQYSVKWNSELLQTGDTINVASRSDRAHKITFGVSRLMSLDTYTYSNSNPNAIDENVIGFAFDNVSFTAGTANTITNTLTVTPTGSGSSASWTGSIVYDGDSTITFSISKSSTDTFRFEGEGYVEWNNIESESTAQAFGRPTYIDCELGEAYKIENDEIISLNKYLDLGSDLPKLSPGANDVTTDNTITELKVVPNWWKL